MKSITRLVLICGSIVLTLSACGGNGKSDPEVVDFGDFVTRQFASTSDRTDPVEINSISFRFDEQEDSDVFENLLN